MANRIPRNAIKIVCEILSGNAQGRKMVYTKDDTGHWMGIDEKGDRWHINWSIIRNEELCRIISIEVDDTIKPKKAATKKFDLFMGCLGNGLTVCNKAVMEGGDYKMVAHISAAGNITFYVSENYIPAEDMAKIRSEAANMKNKYKQEFEKYSEGEQYYRILDSLPTSEFCEAIKDSRPISEKLPELRARLYEVA